MSISKIYNPAEVESKWYKYWLSKGFFHAKPDPSKKPYTIVIPPPNVTGVLHMGHMLNNTIQDILIRRKRMQGFEACWVPGTDHASIATEAKVVAMLQHKGIDKKTIGREKFLEYAWDWKEKYGGIILDQLKRLGASCDWDRTRFTMEKDLSDAVIDVFVDLYNKGMIYRGARMVNWDPQAKTTVSDEEVLYKEVNSKLYFIKYFSETDDTYFTIATTRPETIMADVAIAVHPADDRYRHLIGKKFRIPLLNKPIPVVTDENVDMEYGTGSLKVTPAHDLLDYRIGIKYNLEIIDILHEDGTLNEKAQIYVGEDRFVARKKIAKELEEKGYLLEAKDIVNKVGTSERTGAVIEPRISTQWFVKMKELAKPALDHVLSDEVRFHPKDKFINTYKHWMENVQDWCISRQLWWGHRIPAWYTETGEMIVARTKEEAVALLSKSNPTYTSELTQDEDVLDTWFSSWLWPISVFDGFKKENIDNPHSDFNYFYPTQDLVTAPEIMFFWVARMIMAGYQYTGKQPFSNVYYTGIVRDKQGRKMSKSLGNSPDPLELIQKYSADGVRVGMLYASPAGNDLLFDEKYCEQGRNFANKIWNAYRLTQSWEVHDGPPTASDRCAHEFYSHTFYKSLQEIEDHFEKFRISDALKSLYKLVWDDFCSWYLEMIKPDYGQPISKATYNQCITHLENTLKLMHPFMPFITEEIWQEVAPRQENESLVIAKYPSMEPFKEETLKQAQLSLELISALRNYRSSKGLSPKTPLSIYLKSGDSTFYHQSITLYAPVIKRLANIESIEFVQHMDMPTVSILVQTLECLIPRGDSGISESEKEELQKELNYLAGFIKSVQAKLSNEKFMANAKPEVIENERKKLADALSKTEAIQKQLGQ